MCAEDAAGDSVATGIAVVRADYGPGCASCKLAAGGRHISPAAACVGGSWQESKTKEWESAFAWSRAGAAVCSGKGLA